MRLLRLLFVLALGAGCGAKPAPERPSILLISVDTLRADHLGLYGYARDTSPFLDRLGRESTVYLNAFTSAAWTLIAHMTMLTGFYPEQHGVIEADHALSSSAPLLAERLRAAGYQTLALYRPGWIHERHGFARGFDLFRGHMAVEEAEEHLAEALVGLDRARPYFLFLHLFDVHNDPDTKEPKSVFSTPPDFEDHFLPGAVERMRGHTYPELQRSPRLGEADREALVALYDDGIRHVDAALERIFARLEADGWLEGTLVIVTSDHGESLAQRGRLTGHGGPWQEGLHIPLIVRRPDGQGAGQRVSEVAHLVDVAPTVLAFAGLGRDPLLPGHSLLAPLPASRVVTGGNAPVEFAVQWPLKITHIRGRHGAVDLERDPGEEAPRLVPAAEFEKLRAALDLAPGSRFAPLKMGPLSAEDAAALRALGYGGETPEEEPEGK